MEQVIKYIDFALENVEGIVIDVKNIEYMSILGVSDHHFISRCNKEIKKDKYCSSFEICINKEVDKKYPTYGGESSLTIFERLSKHRDIVYITYLDEDKNQIETIFLPWKDRPDDNPWTFGDTNLNQSSRIDKDGNLIIIVKGEHDA